MHKNYGIYGRYDKTFVYFCIAFGNFGQSDLQNADLYSSVDNPILQNTKNLPL